MGVLLGRPGEGRGPLETRPSVSRDGPFLGCAFAVDPILQILMFDLVAGFILGLTLTQCFSQRLSGFLSFSLRVDINPGYFPVFCL